MVRQRPRRALQAPWQVRVARVAVPSLLIGLGTTGVVAVATGSTAEVQVPASAGAPVTTTTATQVSRQERVTSRDFVRPSLSVESQTADAAKAKAKAAAKVKAAAKAKAKAKAKSAAAAKAKAAARAEKARVADQPSLSVVDTEYTRVALNVRERADAGSDLITVLEPRSKVSVTATVRGDWQHVVYRGESGWVKDQYLVESKPKPARSSTSTAAQKSSGASGGVSSSACPGGSSVESGLTPDAVRLHRALCARFPGIAAFGGVRSDSLPAHPSGRALDAMVSSNGLGQQVADWVRANARQLGVSEVIFARRIWTVQRGSEGWRSMSDRGSPSANHEDHVHVTVYGSAGS